jgi:hypothetical protein
MENTMLEVVGLKAEEWAVRWSELAFQPKSAFSVRRGRKLTPLEFYLGTQLGSYLAVLLTCIGFFAIFYRNTLAQHLKQDGSVLLALTTAGYGLFALVSFIAVFVAAILSFAVFRMASSPARFRSHLRANLELSFLDPIALFMITLIILFAPDESHPASRYWVYSAPAVFVLARLWSLYVAFRAMAAVHSLPRSRFVATFWLAYVPSFLLVNALVAALAWLYVVLAVGVGD